MPAPWLLEIFAVDLGLVIKTTIMSTAIQVSKSAGWNGTEILNRSSPILTYSSSASQEVSVTLSLHATYNAEVEVLEPIKSCLSLMYPVVPGHIPPSTIILNCGPVVKDFKCVCTSCSVSYGENGWRPDATPMHAEVSLSFQEYDPDNTAAAEVSAGSTYMYPFGGI